MAVQRRTFHPVGFGRGALTGWKEYRYGNENNHRRLAKQFGVRINPRTTARVPVGNTQAESVADWITREPHRTILATNERKKIEAALAIVLKPYEANRWEGEAAARAGLRLGFIERGFEWDESDAEAADIVRAVYISLGRGVESRPTWDQGQAFSAYQGERCLFCFDKIDDAHMLRGWVFCSPSCARNALKIQDWEFGNAQKSKIGQQATKIARLLNLPARPCAECGELFQPDSFEVKYCSEKCREPHIGKARVLPDLDCPNCSKTFRPRNAEQKYCSQQCAAEHRSYIEPRPCAECGKEFKPHDQRGGKFCSAECSTAHATRRKPELGTRHCQQCGNEFYPRNNQAIYCGPRCNHDAKEARKKAQRHAEAANRPLRACECCNRPFQPKRIDSRFCSPGCQRTAANQRAREGPTL